LERQKLLRGKGGEFGEKSGEVKRKVGVVKSFICENL